jgi:hypothetical protein
MGLAARLEGPGVEIPEVLPSSWPSPSVLSRRLRGRALRPEAWGESARGLGVEDRDEEDIMIEYIEAVTWEGARKQPVEGDLLASERLLITGRSPW